MRGSKSTSVLRAGRKLLGFNLWIDIDLVFRAGIKLNWFSCADIIDLFLVWGAIDLVFARVVEMDLVFECWPKITFFYCEHLT